MLEMEVLLNTGHACPSYVGSSQVIEPRSMQLLYLGKHPRQFTSKVKTEIYARTRFCCKWDPNIGCLHDNK